MSRCKWNKRALPLAGAASPCLSHPALAANFSVAAKVTHTAGKSAKFATR